MDAWLSTLITVFGVLGATWLANRKSSKDMAAQWERDDLRRWDMNRVHSYETFVGHVVSMNGKLDVFDTVGKSSLVTAKDLVKDLQAMNFERGRVALFAGSHKIEGAADDVLKAMNDYFGGVIRNQAAPGDDATVEEEHVEPSTKQLADYIEFELKRFTGLVQDQLGIAKGRH